MVKLLAVFAAAMVLAHISEQNTRAVIASGRRYSVWQDWAYLMLATILILFTGLRTSFNDTENYVSIFYSDPGVDAWLSNPKNYNLFTNPVFYLYQSVIKSVFGDAQMLILISSVITQICLLLFFKRYAEHFTFSIFIYFTLGTFVFTLAAMKQVLGMAVATLAFPYLEKKKWVPFTLLVFLAMLIHTYAIAFALLPLLRNRPWKLFTFLFVLAVAAVMMNFEEAITKFMEQANELGKTVADYEVFDNVTVNVFRLAVYAVPPLFSLVFYKWVMHGTADLDHVFIHMSIVSLAFMTMGTQSGANMFGRMGNYFELGTICCLPTMLYKTFNRRSYRMVAGLACICFFGFFFYANGINIDFGQEYRAISLYSFIGNLFALLWGG